MTDDDLREALVLLEQLAPERLPAAAATQAPAAHRASRRRWLLAITASAACVLAVAIGLAVGSHHSTPNANLSAPPSATANTPAVRGPVGSHGCPTTLGSPSGSWVPAKPRGVDTTGRLVPATSAPTSITVCGFIGKNSPAGTSGVVQVAGDLGVPARYLSTIGPSEFGICTANLEPGDGDQFLVHLVYRSGAVWLSVAGSHCGGATNGSFTTAALLGPLVRQWYVDGQVTTPAPESCSARTVGGGRVGEDLTMVPGDPVAAEICVQHPAASGRTITGSQLAGLVQALNAARATPLTTNGECVPTDSPPIVRTYALIFRYASGSTTDLLVFADCTPSIQNGNLQITSAPSIVALVEQLYGSTN